MISDPLFYLLAAVAVTLLGLSKGGFFGLGVMGLPLMSLYVPPLQAAAIILPTVLAQDVLTIWTYRRDWSAWNLKLMIPSMMLGIATGTLFAASLSPAHIRLAIGIIAAVFVLQHWVGRSFARMAIVPGVATGVIFGAIGGFTTLLANAGGPAWQIHLLPQKLDKLTYVGTVTILFAVSNLAKIPAYGALGQLTVENLDGRRAAAAGGGAGELRRHLAGAAHPGRAVLPHRLCADVRHRHRADPRCAHRNVGLMCTPEDRLTLPVVPAQAGTHIPETGVYGSPLTRGRRKEGSRLSIEPFDPTR